MGVLYKFKSARDFDSIPVEGHCISVGALKEKIVLKQKLGSATDFDLVISNADTDEEYLDENFMVYDNASVLVRRVPRKASGASDGSTPEVDTPQVAATITTVEEVEGEVSAEVNEQQASEPACITSDEDIRIKEFVDSSAADWMRQTHDAGANARNHGGCFQRKTPPAGYVCHRCGVAGHFIQHCPTNGDSTYDLKKVKMPSGIPKTMLVADSDGTYALPNGEIAVLQPNEVAFAKEIDGVVPPEPLKEIPAELRCPLCQNALKDAVLTSKCCYKSFCDNCIRSVLLEKATCVCGAKNIRADDLLPNKTLRETVDRLLFGCSSLATTSFSHKPQSQDSTTTNVETTNTVSNNSGERKENEETPDSNDLDEHEDEEELDYDEEGLDDGLNLDELEVDEPSNSPEPSPGVPEKEEEREEEKQLQETKNEEEVIKPQQEKKVQEAPVTQPKPVVPVKPVPPKHHSAGNHKRGNLPPYALQYTGYWSASQMIGSRYGYGGYFPPQFAPPVHFPVQPYARSRTFVARRDYKRNNEPDRRNPVSGNASRQNASDECKQQRDEKRRERERSRSPQPRKRSISPATRSTRSKRERSPSPRRLLISNNKRRRSPSPVRRIRSSNNVDRSRTRSPEARFIDKKSARSRSPQARNQTRLRNGLLQQERGFRRPEKQRREQQMPLRKPETPEPEEIIHHEPLRLRSARTARTSGGIRSRSPGALLYGASSTSSLRTRRSPGVLLYGTSSSSRSYEEFDELDERLSYGDGCRGFVDDVPEKRERVLLQGARVVVKREEPPRSVLRAARGVGMEPGNPMRREEYRRLLREFEESKRPVVRVSAPASTMQRKRVLMRRAPPIGDDEYFDDEPQVFGDEEEYEFDRPVARRTAVFHRAGARFETGEDSDDADDELGVEEADDEMLVQRAGAGRRRRRALKQRVAPVGGGSDDEEGVIPQKRELKKSLLARLSLGESHANAQKGDGFEAGQRVSKKLKAGNNNTSTKCKGTSVFERISFSNKPSSGAQGSGGIGASGGGSRMVVFYGDV